MKTESNYEEKINEQLEQYASVELLHQLPAIRDYWFEKFIGPRVFHVFYGDKPRRGYVYANSFEDILRGSSNERASFLSLGSGDCKLEVGIAHELRARGLDQFQFECLELSDALLQKAREEAEKKGVSDLMLFTRTDLNGWSPNRAYDAVMVHQALHHFVELEKIFAGILQCIGTTGIFITCDVIGRNGHLLWPEALGIIESLWKNLSTKKKFHHQFKKNYATFPNFDCSTKGFEGVRAQDILPLLVKNFSFEYFLGYGGLTDPFVGRGFGDNFKPDSAEDREFIDAVQLMNDTLCDVGYLKPTRMMAICRHPSYQGSTHFFRHWSPEFCQRLVSPAT